jgi:hypothetical protein
MSCLSLNQPLVKISNEFKRQSHQHNYPKKSNKHHKFTGSSFAQVWNLDCGGVVIPSVGVLIAMQKTLLEFGFVLGHQKLRSIICSSKSDCFRKILQTYFPIDCSKVEQQFIDSMMEMFPKIQLKVFLENPELTTIINLPGIKMVQTETQPVVVCSMFPEPIMHFLTKRFHDQGFFPDAIYYPQPSKNIQTRSDLIRLSQAAFSSRVTNFCADAFADVSEISKNFPQINVYGVTSHSAELPENI